MRLNFYACTFVKRFTHYSASYFTLMGHSFHSEVKMGTRYMRWAGYANKKKERIKAVIWQLFMFDIKGIENDTFCTGLAKG